MKRTGEIYNKTDNYLFPRAEKNDINEYLKSIKEDFKINPGETLSDALARFHQDTIELDALVLPDGSIYKGWSGSKITVIQREDGSYKVKQSIETVIMNSLGNLFKAGKNLSKILSGSKNRMEEYYGFYSSKKVNKMEEKQIKTQGKIDPYSITMFRSKNNLPSDYFSQSLSNTKTIEYDINNNISSKGCSK